MSNLALINKKIKSVKTTEKITNALKVVSSNQLYVYKELQKKSLPYMQGIYRIFFEVFNNPDHDIKTTNKHFISFEEKKNELWIVIGSDIGMCGDFNEKMRKYLSQTINRDKDGIIAFGKKLGSLLEKEFGEIVEYKSESELEMANIEKNIGSISLDFLKLFMKNNYRKLTVLYVKNPKEGIIEKIKVLPFTEKYFPTKKKITGSSFNTSFFYPEIIIDIFPQYFECILLGSIIGSKIQEHNIRSELMHSATKNARELLDEYTLTFNKLRQANITREITEIVAAVKSRRK